MSGLVFSDLHLFARRSAGEACWASLRGQRGAIDVLVLNGDIFDFRWSTLPTVEASLREACAWLEALLRAFPDCRVHYVLGNHDCLAEFEAQLTAIRSRHERFAWHPFWLRLGPNLFVHGDCAHCAMDADGFRAYRARWRSDRRRGSNLTNWAYVWADRLGLTRLVHAWQFPRRATIRRLFHYLDGACPGWQVDTTDCFFGHTHLPFSNVTHGGVRFHNTGCAIRGARFNPCRFQLRP